MKLKTARLSAGILAITLAANSVVLAQNAPTQNASPNTSSGTMPAANNSTSSTGTTSTGTTPGTAVDSANSGMMANGGTSNNATTNGTATNGTTTNGGATENPTIVSSTNPAAPTVVPPGSVGATTTGAPASVPAGVVTAAATNPVVSATGVVTTGLADARNAADANAPVFTLSDALTLALQNNPTVASAQASIRAAQARVGEASAAGGPQVGANANLAGTRNLNGAPVIVGSSVGGGGGGGGTTGGGTTGGGSTGGISSSPVVADNLLGFGATETAGLTATLPIYTGGRVSANKRIARSNVNVQTENALQTEQDLLLNTTTSYLNILRSSQLLTVAVSNVDVSREQLRVAQVRYDAGAAARLEVYQAQATLADAEQRRIAASATLGQSTASLNTLMGRTPETPLRVEEITSLTLNLPTLTTANGTSLSSSDLRLISAQSRPAIAASQAQITTSEANVALAKAQRRPSLGLSLGALIRNPLTYLGRFALSLGLGLTQTIFDSGLSRSQISEAQALVDQSRAGLSSTQLNVGNQIEQSLLNLDSAQSRTVSADVAVTAAQEALRAAQVGYQAGVRTSLDVTTAQTALLNAQTNAVNARFDVATGQAQLASSVGVLTVAGQDATSRVTQAQNAANDALQASANANKPKKKRKKFLGIF